MKLPGRRETSRKSVSPVRQASRSAEDWMPSPAKNSSAPSTSKNSFSASNAMADDIERNMRSPKPQKGSFTPTTISGKGRAGTDSGDRM